jgi:hypothetical protein
MNREAYAQWKLETGLIEEQLARIERAEHAILKEIGCPTDPVGVYAILAGEQPPPWPKRHAEPNRRRAAHAMYALLHVQQTRRYLGPLNENPRLAAYAALMAGALAGDVLINAAMGTTVRRKNRASGKKRWSDKDLLKLQTRDKQIWRAAKEYKATHPHATTRKIASEVKKALKLREAAETVRSRLRLLGRRVTAGRARAIKTAAGQ